MIINKLAFLIKNMIENLYIKDIKFYQIIIGLIIFNFIIYLICKIVKIAKNQNFKF